MHSPFFINLVCHDTKIIKAFSQKNKDIIFINAHLTTIFYIAILTLSDIFILADST